MKHFLIAVLLVASFSTFAQVQPRLQNTLAHVFGTMTTFEIEKKVYQMKQDGVTERSFSTFFNSEGQLVELNDGEVNCGAYEGSVAGTDIIPYTIKISDDGRVFLDVGLIKFFEMHDYGVQNSVSFITFEYNKNYDYSQNSELTLNLVKGALSEIYEGDRASIRIQLNGGVHAPLYAQFNSATQPLDLKGGLGLKFGGDFSGSLYVNKKQDLKVDFGTEASVRLNRHYNFMSDATRARQSDDNARWSETYDAAMQSQTDWDQDKFDWEVANGQGSSMSADHYMAASGASARPKLPTRTYGGGDDAYQQRVKRTTILLTPSVSFTKEFKNKNNKVKSSLQVELSANLYLRDKFKGALFNGINNDWGTQLKDEEIVNVNMLKNGLSRNTYGIRLVYKFGNGKY